MKLQRMKDWGENADSSGDDGEAGDEIDGEDRLP